MMTRKQRKEMLQLADILFPPLWMGSQSVAWHYQHSEVFSPPSFTCRKTLGHTTGMPPHQWGWFQVSWRWQWRWQLQFDLVMRYLDSQLGASLTVFPAVINIWVDEPSTVWWEDQPSKGQKELEEEEMTPALSYVTGGHIRVPLAFGLELELMLLFNNLPTLWLSTYMVMEIGPPPRPFSPTFI